MKNPDSQLQKIGLSTAIAIVVANMIGTGVFTSLGFQISGLKSVFALLMLWLVGGLIAFSGALTYGEISAIIPRSGGEYNFLTKIYHPFIGFLAGWVSLLVGFSAPVALASMALADYFNAISGAGHQKLVALGVVLILSFVHSFNIKFGGKFQRTVTALKILLILSFIIAGLIITEHQPISLIPEISDWKDIFSSTFAVSLIYVSYSFSGWNASVYITDEVKNPEKNVSRSLISGAIIVTILYFMLNFIFLYTSPMNEMKGKIDVGFISAVHIFGDSGGRIMAALIVLLLISTISAMIWIGPRVTEVVGEDYLLFRFLAKKNKMNVPVVAIWFQALITVILVATATFEKVLVYSGFTLNFFTLMSVCGIFILRYKKRPVAGQARTWGYPVTPLIFISLSTWTLLFLIKDRTIESIMGLATILAGAVVYFAASLYRKYLNHV